MHMFGSSEVVLILFAGILIKSNVLGLNVTCTPGTGPCELDPVTRPCLVGMFPSLKKEISDANLIIRDKFAMMFPDEEYTSLCSNLYDVLQTYVNKAFELIAQAENASEDDYITAVLTMYCEISQAFFEDLKTALLDQVRQYNKNSLQNWNQIIVDEYMVASEIDTTVITNTNTREKYFDQSELCFQCSSLFPHVGAFMNRIGALCRGSPRLINMGYRGAVTICKQFLWL